MDAIRDKDSQSAKDTLRSLLLTLSDKRRETPLQFARGSENNDTLTAYNYHFMYNGSVLADIADILEKQILILFEDSEDEEEEEESINLCKGGCTGARHISRN